ncbi:PAS domain-containing protein [uncultured Arcobacter sp.]|uniref:PAS domain-containing protein n=1 Tax=uncultured Arcobacter sp. TaxID=165434 RepID=UPI00262143F3|nr:PAS domain-containing protein [uncultured Arcobacter sp.]
MSEEVKLSADTMIVSETDAKGIIQYANSDFCKIAGYSKEELIGKPHNYVRHPDMPKAAFEDLWKTIQSGNIWNGIVKNKTKDGGYYWVNATAYPSKNSNGVLRYISVRVKPTDKEIENAISLYKTLD